MKPVFIKMERLVGEITPITSKSIAHRVLLAGLLSRSKTEIINLNNSHDVIATLKILEAIGCRVSRNQNQTILDATNLSYNRQVLDCHESASTFRILLPSLVLLFNHIEITAQKSLQKRPLDYYQKLFEIKGNEKYPLTIKKFLVAGKYQLANPVSSQFISGLLFALPLLDGDSEIIIDCHVGSSGYLDLTIEVLTYFGIKIMRRSNGFLIPGNQIYQPNLSYQVASDESNLAYFKLANYLGSDIKFNNYHLNSLQPDYIFDEILKTKPSKIDVNQFPDLFPILILACCFFKTSTTIINYSRLAYKESNRINTVIRELIKLQAKLEIKNNQIVVSPINQLKATSVSSHGDHRVAMMLVIAQLKTEGSIKIDDVSVINKSYPNFINQISQLTGEIINA